MNRIACFGLAVSYLLACNAGPPTADDPDGSSQAGVDARSSPDAAAQPVGFPDPDWATADPGDHGLDPGTLNEAAAYAQSIGSSCMAVIRDGRLVYERYWNGATPTSVHKTWSIAKSFTSTLIGIAIDRGDIASVDQPVSDYVSEWQDADRYAITISDVLSMSSGLEFDMVADNMFAVLVNDQTQRAIDLTVAAPPGTEWNYSNRAVQVLHRVLEVATGVDPEDYATEHLWRPIGMNLEGDDHQRTRWERDDSGNATMYMSVYSSCRDLARLGYLFLHNGRWRERQVISADYVRAATSPSQALNPIYGYLWWVNGGEPAMGSTGQAFDGTMMSFAPADLFSAQGLGQTFIDVVPSTNSVYVHIRQAPHDPFVKFITDPQGTMDALFRDGMRIEHKQLMRILLDASGD